MIYREIERKPKHFGKGKSSPEVLRQIREEAEARDRLVWPYDGWPALSPLVTSSEGDWGMDRVLFGTEDDPGLARLAGWKVAHVSDSRLQPEMEGFPDWVLVREIVLFVELKNNRDRLRPAQTGWAVALMRAQGVMYELWRPQDWERIGRIVLHGPHHGL